MEDCGSCEREMHYGKGKTLHVCLGYQFTKVISVAQ